MKQSRRRQPGHERGVFDRIPEPPPAPAELIIGPVDARRDAEREEDPGGEHPGPHRPRESCADVAGDERADREGKSDRDADIAEVERRRMEGEARRSEEHTSELQSLMRIPYAGFCLKKKKHSRKGPK